MTAEAIGRMSKLNIARISFLEGKPIYVGYTLFGWTREAVELFRCERRRAGLPLWGIMMHQACK